MAENNLSIMDLRDIVIPEPLGFWPPAPFAWILLSLVGIGLLFLIWRGLIRWNAGAYRREGLAHLARIEVQFETAGQERAALQDLSVLLKRVALATFPRRQVAPLYGQAWLHFLDSTCNDCTFRSDSGKLLFFSASPESTGSPVNSGDGRALLSLSRTWIESHSILVKEPFQVDNTEKSRMP